MKSWEITRAVRDYGPEDPVQNHVLLIVSTYADEDGGCWPSQVTLVRGCRLCRRSVQYRLAELEHDGWIVINPKAAKDHKGNTYQIVLSKLTKSQAHPDAPENGGDEKSGASGCIGQAHLVTKSGASGCIRYKEEPSGTIIELTREDSLSKKCKVEIVSGKPLLSPRQHVEAVWGYYREKVSKQHSTLTKQRLEHGLARFEDALKKTKGDRSKASALMEICVDTMVASDWHMGRDKKTEGKKYNEWENVFRSTDQFEWWLEKAEEA